MRRTIAWGLTSFVAVGCVACAAQDPRRWRAADLARARADVACRTGQAVPADSLPECAGGGDDRVVAHLLREPLTDAAAVRAALVNNPAMREGYETLGVARAREVQAGLLSNPSLGAALKVFPDGPEVELDLMQSLLDVVLRSGRRAEAAAELRAEEASVVADAVGLVYDVRRAMVGLRAAKRLVEAHEKTVAGATASRELMDSLHEAGNVTDDRRTAEHLAESRAEIDLSAARADVRLARARLAALLGLVDASTPWDVDAALADRVPADLDAADVERRAEAASLHLLALRSRVEAAARRRGIAVRRRGMLLHEVGAVAKREASDGSWGGGPEVRLELPVFDSGVAREALADAEIRRLLARYAGARVEVRTAAALRRDRAAELRARATLLREKHLPQRARYVREVVERYHAMQIGAFEVLRAKQQETDARREYVETLRDAWLARVDLEEVLAGRLGDEGHPSDAAPRHAERTESKEDHR